jgi:hypothetical protein
METQEKEFQALYSKFLEWQASQATQTDGFEYERSFIEFCRLFNKELLLIASKPLADEPKKKSSPPLEV